MYLVLLFCVLALSQIHQQALTLTDALRNCANCDQSIFTPQALQDLESRQEPFTLFIPNKQALLQDQQKLQSTYLRLMLNLLPGLSPQDKQNLVQNHVLSGNLEKLRPDVFQTLAGKSIPITGQEGSF
jgi:hypothetical protein